MKAPDILRALAPIADAFERLGVSYHLGGSVASSAYGIARATLDVDVVSDLRTEDARPLAEILGSAYYIDEEMILEAIERRSSFNLIHLETMLKIDVFVLKSRDYDREAFRRRRKDTLDEEHGSAPFYLASPEDIVLNKLEWFKMGGGTSERQWGDILGVLKVQGSLLDMGYLRLWASRLGLADPLEQALREAGVSPQS